MRRFPDRDSPDARMVLENAPAVVAEEQYGRLHHPGRGPVVDFEGVETGARKQAVEVQEKGGIRPGVTVDGLVVVPHPEDREARRCQQPDEEYVCGCEVLELVHQEVSATPLPLVPEVRLGEKHLDGAVHLLVVVGLTALGEAAAVVGEDPGEVGDVVAVLLDRHRVSQGDPHVGQRLDVGTDDVRVEPGFPRDQPA